MGRPWRGVVDVVGDTGSHLVDTVGDKVASSLSHKSKSKSEEHELLCPLTELLGPRSNEKGEGGGGHGGGGDKEKGGGKDKDGDGAGQRRRPWGQERRRPTKVT